MFGNLLTWILILLIVAAGTVSCNKENPVTPEPPEEEEPFIPKDHPIGVRNAGGKAEFYHKNTGEKFIPRGVNYFYIVSTPDGFLQDRFFGIGEFDESRVRADFQELTDHGYNVVRIFLDTCSSGSGSTGKPDGNGLNPAYLDNIKQTMDLAKETGYNPKATSSNPIREPAEGECFLS